MLRSTAPLAMRRALVGRASLRTAFTLIELLVVIAIIALLVGILLPALANARKASRQAACLSNNRQMGITFNQYGNDSKNWFPLLPMTAVARTNFNNPNQAARYLDQQYVYGGVAGMFSLHQNPDGGEGTPTGDYGYAGDVYAPDAAGRTSNIPILRAYVDGYGVLICPSDREDRYYNTPYTLSAPGLASARSKVPKIAASEYEVVSYNISYLYIAGMKTDESVLVKPAPLWGDETMAPDLSTRAWYFDSRDQPAGAGVRPGYYQSWDNHGADGADFVFSDGHAELVKYNVQETFFDAATRTNGQSVNVIDQFRSRRVQTID